MEIGALISGGYALLNYLFTTSNPTIQCAFFTFLGGAIQGAIWTLGAYVLLQILPATMAPWLAYALAGAFGGGLSAIYTNWSRGNKPLSSAWWQVVKSNTISGAIGGIFAGSLKFPSNPSTNWGKSLGQLYQLSIKQEWVADTVTALGLIISKVFFPYKDPSPEPTRYEKPYYQPLYYGP